MTTTTKAGIDRQALRAAWTAERDAAGEARRQGDEAGEWKHLERAHIVSQPMAVAHVRSHVAMLAAGMRHHDRAEVLGQLLRMVVAAPGSWTGRYPIGNTGGADVSALRPMPIPDDLRELLEPAELTPATTLIHRLLGKSQPAAGAGTRGLVRGDGATHDPASA